MYSSIFLVSYFFDFIYYKNLFIICIRIYRTVIDQAGKVLYEDSGSDSVSMDINDNDNQTVGCAIARAACADFLSNSDSDDISNDDYDSSCAKTCYPVGLKSDCGGQVSELFANDTQKRINHQPLQKHAIIYFVFLIS
jgi:hypothetical protein